MISLNSLSLNLFLLLTTSRKPSILLCISALSLILKKVRGKKEKGLKKKKPKTPNVNVELSTIIAVSTFQVILDSRSSLKFLKRDKWFVTKKSG